MDGNILARYFSPGFGLIYCGKEALPNISSAAQLFAGAPDEAILAVACIRTTGITIQFDGTNPTAGTLGIDYPVGTFEFPFTALQLKKIKGIQNGGTSTGYIVYFKAGS